MNLEFQIHHASSQSLVSSKSLAAPTPLTTSKLDFDAVGSNENIQGGAATAASSSSQILKSRDLNAAGPTASEGLKRGGSMRAPGSPVDFKLTYPKKIDYK